MRDKIATAIRLGKLTARYFNGVLAESELRELNDWLCTNQQNRANFLKLFQPDELRLYQKEVESTNMEEILFRLNLKLQSNRNIRIILIRWAAILGIITWATVFMIKHHMKPQKEIQHSEKSISEIEPGSQKAKLILGNGECIDLNRGSDTTIMKNKSILVCVHSNLLTFQQTDIIGATQLHSDKTTEYNTLVTPRGGEYHLVLSDGTNVWLNAASSIYFPSSFSGPNRRVEIYGEAYFDVVKSESKPFIVSARDVQIEVLGTAFNINTYLTNKKVLTTLIKGSVKIINRKQQIMLIPGQTGIAGDGDFKIERADTSSITGWRLGLFIFDQIEIPDLMNRLIDWYDIEVSYSPAFKKRQHFTGTFSRYISLNKLLQMIEETGIAKFDIQGRKIVVLPADNLAGTEF